MKSIIPIFILLVCISCGKLEDSNVPAVIMFSYYKNGHEIDYFTKKNDTLVGNKIMDSLSKDFRLRIIPRKALDSIIEDKKLQYNTHSTTWFPLYRYYSKKEMEKMYEELAPEQFQLTIYYKDREFVDLHLENHYEQIGQPWLSVKRTYYWDEKGEKKEYTFPKYKIFDDKGNPTEFEFKFNLYYK